MFAWLQTENLMAMAAFTVPPIHFLQGTQASGISTSL